MRVITGEQILDHEAVLHDTARALRANPALLDAIVSPESEDDLVAVMRHDHPNLTGFPITETCKTAQGAGTGLTGGRAPLPGGFVVPMDRFRSVSEDGPGRVIETNSIRYRLDFDTNVGYFPPGITLNELDDLLEGYGLWLAPNPTAQSAQLGACATNDSSGARTFGFGSMRNSVHSLRSVLADGEVLALQRKQVLADPLTLALLSKGRAEYLVPVPALTRMPSFKTAAGYFARSGMDALDLLVGSEGTLGFVSEVGLQLLPRRNIDSGILFFNNENKAFEFMVAAQGRRLNAPTYQAAPDAKSLGLMSLEYFDRNSLRLAATTQEVPVGSVVGLGYEHFAHDPETFDWLCGTFDESYGPFDGGPQGGFAGIRHSVPVAVNEIVAQHGIPKRGTDFSVALPEYAALHAAYLRIGQEFTDFCRAEGSYSNDDVHYAIWGHFGDCHLHFNFIPRTPGELVKANELYFELVTEAMAKDGSISAEHGVGKKTLRDGEGAERPYLYFMQGGLGLQDLAATKSALDPHWLLNRGNVVPVEYKSRTQTF